VREEAYAISDAARSHDATSRAHVRQLQHTKWPSASGSAYGYGSPHEQHSSEPLPSRRARGRRGSREAIGEIPLTAVNNVFGGGPPGTSPCSHAAGPNIACAEMSALRRLT